MPESEESSLEPTAGDAPSSVERALHSFFRPGAREPLQPIEQLRPGRVVGDFRLVELLAQGGMGQVWKAEQLSLGDRHVAIKFIRPERVSERQTIWFDREARAGGRLSHPGIVSTYGHGESDGMAWIAMELVEGAWTLRDYLDEASKEESVPADYDRHVAGFVCDVATAMHAAHERGVIHRDLKPQNILITSDNRPKVTDFGLARITDESALSKSGDTPGTLFYMSPEQVAANRAAVDHRTDIFSLGVILYEMLAMQRPFQGDTSHQVAHQITSEDPIDLRKIRSRIPRDLAVITGKAMEKEPGNRYATMAELVEDLRRHLADEPIRAKPPTSLERASKWARRHPTASSLAVLGTIGVVVILVLLAEMMAARRDADLEAAAANRGRQEATTQRNEALAAKAKVEEEAKETRLVREFLEWTLSSTDPWGRFGKDVKQVDVLRSAALEIGDRFHGRPENEAAIRRVIGDALFQLGWREEAEPHLRAALETYRSTLGEDHVDTLRAMNGLAVLLVERGEYQEAEDLYGTVLEAYQRDFGSEHLQTLRVVNNLALLYYATGRLEEAESNLVRALEVLRRTVGEDDPDTLDTAKSLIVVLLARGETDRAESLLRESLETSRRTTGNESQSTLLLINDLASLLQDKGELRAAEEYYRESLDVRSRIVGRAHPLTWTAMSNLASMLFDLDEIQEAEELVREIVDLQRDILPEDHPEALSTLSNLAVLLDAQGKDSEALEVHQRMLDAWLRIHGPDHPDTLATMQELGSLLMSMGRYDEAEPLLRETLDKRRKFLGDGHQATLNSMHGLAVLLRLQGRLDEAEPLQLGAMEGFRREYGEDNPMTLVATNQYAILLEQRGELARAAEFFREVWEVQRRSLGEQHRDTVSTRNNLANALERTGSFAEAEDLYRETAALLTRALGPEDPETLSVRNQLALVLGYQGELAESERIHREVLEVRLRTLGEKDPDTLTSMNNLAFLLHSARKLEEARGMYERVLQARLDTLGEAHSDTLTSMHNLAGLHLEARELEEAEKLAREVVDLRELHLGERNPLTLVSMELLAMALRARGKLDDAIRCYEDLLTRAEPEAEFDYALFRIGYGICLLEKERYADAEERLLSGYEILKRILEPGHARIAACRSSIIRLYEAWGRPDDARAFRDE